MRWNLVFYDPIKNISKCQPHIFDNCMVSPSSMISPFSLPNISLPYNIYLSPSLSPLSISLSLFPSLFPPLCPLSTFSPRPLYLHSPPSPPLSPCLPSNSHISHLWALFSIFPPSQSLTLCLSLFFLYPSRSPCHLWLTHT